MDEPETGVGAALGGTGAPSPTVTFCGTPWRIGWPTGDAKIWHELLVAQYAEDGLKERARTYPPDDLRAKQKALETDLRAGHHKVLGALWVATVNGPDSMPLFLLSLLKEHQPTATLADAKVLWGAATRELRLALALVLPPFAKLLIDGAPVPQEQKAARTAALTALFLDLATMGEMPNSSAAPTG